MNVNKDSLLYEEFRSHSETPIKSELASKRLDLQLRKKSLFGSKLRKLIHGPVLNSTSALPVDSSFGAKIPSPHPLQPRHFKPVYEPIRFGIAVVIRLALD